MSKEDMASTSGTELSCSASSPASRVSPLRASISDAWHIAALKGDKYSPNLSKWLTSKNGRFFGRTPGVFRDPDGMLWIGWPDDDGWFVGARLGRVTVKGARTECGAHPVLLRELIEMPGFWDEYIRIGRCAIDPDHRMPWVGVESRWLTDGDHRDCLWCGEYSQNQRHWVESVDRSRWEKV